MCPSTAPLIHKGILKHKWPRKRCVRSDSGVAPSPLCLWLSSRSPRTQLTAFSVSLALAVGKSCRLFLFLQVLCVEAGRVGFSRNILLLPCSSQVSSPSVILRHKDSKLSLVHVCVGPSQPTEIFHTILKITTLNLRVLGVFTRIMNEQGTFHRPSCPTLSFDSLLS